MSCTRVLDYFPHKPTMAVDIAMQLYLHSPPLRRDRFTCKKEDKPLRPCIQLNSRTELSSHGSSGASRREKKRKKRVSFADHKGFSLTMVKVFSEFDDPLDVSFHITELIENLVGLTTVEKDSFVLDFVQPSADYLDFRNRLQTDCVCLENCILKDKTIAGTVKVKNLAFCKSVKIRLTFDTWKSYTDYECQYVKDTYAGSDWDTFCFEVHLPEKMLSHERLEFAVCFDCEGKTYWDSNKGQNYMIIRSELKTAHLDGSHFGISFDQYGSPRCSHGIVPEWPSYSGYDKIGPYY